DLDDPGAIGNCQGSIQRSTRCRGQGNSKVFRVTHGAAEYRRPAVQPYRSAGRVRKRETKSAAVSGQSRAPSERRLFPSLLQFAIDVQAGDIGIAHDEAGP